MDMREEDRKHWFFFVSKGILIALLLVFASNALYKSRKAIASSRPALNKERPPLYLPETKKVRLITLGYDRFVANLLWFNTLNYFGQQLSRDADYTWLGHMCELVTDLDPKNRPVMDFCATMLSWVAQEPELSTRLLSKAINAEPDYWRYQYLLGFNYWYFHENKRKAKSILQAAAQLPDAPTFLASLAARLTVDEDNPAHALQFLRDIQKRSNDSSAKQALEEKIRLAEVSRDIDLLNTLIEKYEKSQNKRVFSFKQLLDAGMIAELPVDPFGEEYVLNSEERKIYSLQGKRGLVFNGKTATTGLARFERRQQ